MENTVFNAANQESTSQQIMQVINQASFALDDVLLYLDTHPCDQAALTYYQYVKDLRKQAMDAYTSQYGPLMKDQVKPGNYWNWVTEKWPWEGGVN